MRIRLRSGWNTALTLAAAAAAASKSTSRIVGVHQVSSFAFRSTGSKHPRGNNSRSFLQHRHQSVFQRMAMSSSSSSSAPSDAAASAQSEPVVRFVDIGANLMDERYTDGIYYGKKRHEQDFDLVLDRALEQGVTHIILTAGTLQESRNAVQMVEIYRNKWEEENNNGNPPLFLGCTVGVHPTRCQQEFVDNLKDGQTADDILNELAELLSHGADRGYVVAIGEFGLDYDRLEFAPKDVQLEFFRRQLQKYLRGDNDNSSICDIPLFLHNRSVGRDLLDILLEHNKDNSDVPIKGVVHSFDDSLELALAFIDLGLYIGLNGCSLKTEQNLEVVRELPLDKILLETDCPYCEIKATHAGHKHIQTTFAGMKKADKKFETGKMVKGRNEPCQIVQVAEVIAGVKGIPVEEVARVCYQNSMDLYSGFSKTKTPATIH
jgi:TatD DNase family protein